MKSGRRIHGNDASTNVTNASIDEFAIRFLIVIIWKSDSKKFGKVISETFPSLILSKTLFFVFEYIKKYYMRYHTTRIYIALT